MVRRFILNEVSHFGPGARQVLPDEVKRFGGTKALLVTDKGLIKFGVAKLVTDVLDAASVNYEIYSEIKPNPTVTNVLEGVEAAKAACDAVRALAVRVGIPQHLTELGITENDIPRLAQQAMEDVCTPGNPREVTIDDVITLYKKVL